MTGRRYQNEAAVGASREVAGDCLIDVQLVIRPADQIRGKLIVEQPTADLISMPRTCAAIAFALAVVGCGASPPSSEPARRRADIDLQGHRGARGLEPENTLPAFERALAIGVTTLELDVGLTADGVVIVTHDPRLNPDVVRLAGAWITEDLVVSELPYSVLARFDVGSLKPGSRYAARFPEQQQRQGTSMPTLAEVIALAEERSGKTIRYNIEAKLDPTRPDLTASPDKMVAAIVRAVRDAGVAERVTLQSFDWRAFRHAGGLKTVCLTSSGPDGNLQREQPGASPWLGGLDADDFSGTPELVVAAGCSIWSPDYGALDRAAIDRAHELGLRVIPWTVNEPAELRRMLELGVDGLITDHPERARSVMAERDLPLPPRHPAR